MESSFLLLVGLVLSGVMWQEAMSVNSVYEDAEGHHLVVSAVYGSRISLTCSESRERLGWRVDNLSDINVMYRQGIDGTWSSTINFDAVIDGNKTAECLTRNSEGANYTVVNAFILQVKKHVAPTNFKVVQLNSSALHLTWDSLSSYTFTDSNASVLIDPMINGYYLWISTNSSSVDERSQIELKRNSYVYVKPQELDQCSVLKFQVGVRLRFIEEVTRSAMFGSCLARVNEFSKKDVKIYPKDRMLYFTIQVKTSCYCSFPTNIVQFVLTLSLNSTSGVTLTHNHSFDLVPDSNLPHVIAFSLENQIISSSEHINVCISLSYGDGSDSSSFCSIDFEPFTATPSTVSDEVMFPSVTPNLTKSTTVAIAVSTSSAVVFIGLVIVLVILAAWFLKAKSKPVGESPIRTYGHKNISHAAAHISTESEPGPNGEGIVDATQRGARLFTIQTDDDINTITCRAYNYVRSC